MAEIRINATGGVKLYDADDSHYAQIVAGTISSNVDVLTLGSSSADFNIPVKVLGTTPTLTIGDAGAEDTKIVFDGNAQDFYIALDDSADDLLIGLGSTVGTTPAIAIDENLKVNIPVTTASTSASTGSLTTGGGAGIGADLYVGDDVYLITDSAVLGFGADKDTTLTHTDGTGLTLNSTNKLCFNDASQFIQGSSNAILALGATDEIDLTATAVDLNGTLDVSGNSQFSGTVTVGVDDTGKDVKLFGASAGAYMEWDESADELRIMGASADATTSTGKLLLATSLTDINANDVIGKIDFQAPHEAGGTDAITVAASIQAVAQGTFSSSVNATDLIFYTGHSEAAAEKVRITSQNEIGIAGANYGTDGQVLTSGGAGAAVAWEDAAGFDVSSITGATALDAVPAATDEFVLSDAGTLKRTDFKYVVSRILLQTTTISNGDGDATIGNLLMTSDYTRFEIEFHTIRPATDQADIDVRVDTSGGTQAGNDYSYHSEMAFANQQDTSMHRATADARFDRMWGQNVGNDGADAGYSGTMYVINPSDTNRSCAIFTKAWGEDSDTYASHRWTVGIFSPNDAVQAFNIKPSTGNFKSGTVKVYGIL